MPKAVQKKTRGHSSLRAMGNASPGSTWSVLQIRFQLSGGDVSKNKVFPDKGKDTFSQEHTTSKGAMHRQAP